MLTINSIQKGNQVMEIAGSYYFNFPEEAVNVVHEALSKIKKHAHNVSNTRLFMHYIFYAPDAITFNDTKLSFIYERRYSNGVIVHEHVWFVNKFEPVTKLKLEQILQKINERPKFKLTDRQYDLLALAIEKAKYILYPQIREEIIQSIKQEKIN